MREAVGATQRGWAIALRAKEDVGYLLKEGQLGDVSSPMYKGGALRAPPTKFRAQG